MEAERKKLHDDAEREIDALVREFHALLGPDQARAIGAIYARYSSRLQHSIADQVRGCLQAAVQQGIYVPRENIFFDQAIRGAKQRRPGFDRLKEHLACRRTQVLLVFTTNRLARKTYKALQFVEEEVVGRGIRCVFVRSGVDTADEKRWRILLNNYANIDEFVATMYAENIRVAHEALFRLKLVIGTVSFGYRGRPIAGSLTRQNKERCENEIDPDTAPWVVKIFHWYVHDRLPIAEIIRRLNDDPTVPLGPRAISGRWTRLAVKLLLANPRYRGFWMYGNTHVVWQPRQDYARKVVRDQPLAQQQFEELRILDDTTWYAASQRLTEEQDRNNRGRNPVDGDRQSRPRLLNRLFVCATHDRILYVGGPNGKTMICPECQGLPADKRPLFSHLNRVLALRLTCTKLAELVRADATLVASIAAACTQEVERAQQIDPAYLAGQQARIDRLSQRIKFVLSNSGDTEVDRQESEAELRRLRAERAQLESDSANARAANDRPKKMPTEQEIVKELNEMGAVLAAASTTTSAETASMAREVIERLTNGRIELEQQGERRAQRGWLRGRFRVRLLDVAVNKLLGVTAIAPGVEVEVAIDYLKPTEAETWAEPVKDLYDRGLLLKAIAKELGIGRNLAHSALETWHRQRGLEPPTDGRSRRSQLTTKHLEPPQYQAIADEVKRRMDNGQLLHEIATDLKVDRNTVTAAKDHWYASRGLQPLDGRTRRKDLHR